MGGRMKKTLLILTTYVVALSFWGCASHAPSAAQFMNVKGGDNVAVGGTFQVGDAYNGHYVNEDDYKADEGRAFLDLALYFTAKNFVFGFSSENVTIQSFVGYRWKNFGLLGWFDFNLPEELETPISGGLMLVEEIPVTCKFRVGFSEHLSRNGYAVDLNGGGLGSPATGYFAEVGAGTYLAYGGFSFEVKYGRDFTGAMNRIYLMTHYGFKAN